MLSEYLKQPVPEIIDFDYHSAWEHHKNIVYQHFTEEHIQINLNGTRTTQGQNWHTPIPNHNYTTNQQNWHGTNFTTNPDLLTAGDSITAGYALNHQHTWPHILANHTNQTLNNIGWPGASIAQTIHITYNHIHHWGTPKHIHICLPDITRSWATHNNQNQPIWYNPTTTNYHTHQKTTHKFKQTSPDKTKKTPPLQTTLNENIRTIQHLTNTLTTLKTTLTLTTHNNNTHQTLHNHPNYKHHNPQNPNTPIGHPNCCNHPGTTWAKNNNHPGTHPHHHIAETHHGQPIPWH
jgi:hypothetical protein